MIKLHDTYRITIRMSFLSLRHSQDLGLFFESADSIHIPAISQYMPNLMIFSPTERIHPTSFSTLLSEMSESVSNKLSGAKSGLMGPNKQMNDNGLHAQELANSLLTEKHYPNESLKTGFPPPEVKFNMKKFPPVGIPPIPDFTIPSHHPGSFPPPGGPSVAGTVEIPNTMYPQTGIKNFAGFSAMLNAMSALDLLKQSSSQAISVLKNNLATRVRSEEAFLEASQMDPDLTTRNMLQSMRAQARSTSARSERLIHALAMSVRQAELAVAAMKENMSQILHLPAPGLDGLDSMALDDVNVVPDLDIKTEFL